MRCCVGLVAFGCGEFGWAAGRTAERAEGAHVVGRGVAAVLELELPWQQASVGWGRGRGRGFSCRSRSKLQQTSGKALPLSGRDREVEKTVSE